jgi:N-acetylglucosaminyl-diphospho-decaprenol L-rhamnosyltransferase
MTPGNDRLAVIIVSHNSAGWLSACLSSVYANAGNLELDIVVVDSGSSDETVDLVRREFPGVRVLPSENRGFAAANNRGLEVVEAEWILFLNPDTRILSGTLEQLVSLLRARPTVGLAGVRQIDEDGVMDPTMRRFPNALRSLSVSLGGERLPLRASWLGERVLATDLYDRETVCDWTVGSFMLARKAAIDDVGGLDERFFIYCEETDLCLRLSQAGWRVAYFPQMTIFHQSSVTSSDARLNRQMAFARRQYIEKHFAPVHRAAAILTLGLGYALRGLVPGRGLERHRRRASAWSAFATLIGLTPPPFGAPLHAGDDAATGKRIRPER